MFPNPHINKKNHTRFPQFLKLLKNLKLRQKNRNKNLLFLSDWGIDKELTITKKLVISPPKINLMHLWIKRTLILDTIQQRKRQAKKKYKNLMFLAMQELKNNSLKLILMHLSQQLIILMLLLLLSKNQNYLRILMLRNSRQSPIHMLLQSFRNQLQIPMLQRKSFPREKKRVLSRRSRFKTRFLLKNSIFTSKLKIWRLNL